MISCDLHVVKTETIASVVTSLSRQDAISYIGQ